MCVYGLQPTNLAAMQFQQQYQVQSALVGGSIGDTTATGLVGCRGH